MTDEFAIVDHRRHGYFKRPIALSVDRLPDHGHSSHQIGRGNHIAKPDSRCERHLCSSPLYTDLTA